MVKFVVAHGTLLVFFITDEENDDSDDRHWLVLVRLSTRVEEISVRVVAYASHGETEGENLKRGRPHRSRGVNDIVSAESGRRLVR